jgi:5-oxoprolinase (ATP-hydrolysing) subunit A
MIDRVDINSDLGEGWGAWTIGDDAAMLQIVTSANLACGFHGGDPDVIARSIDLARDGGVAIGAHPSFNDLIGFGRRQIVGDSPETIKNTLLYQIAALTGMATAIGHRVTHVKTHGSLGNMAAVDDELAGAVAGAVRALDRDLILVVMPGNALERAARAHGLRMANEIYADRTYDDDGNLTPRRQPGAVIHDAAEAQRRAMRMLEDGAIISTTGKRIPVRIDTICVHGDNPSAVAMARGLRTALEQVGIGVRPFHSFVE